VDVLNLLLGVTLGAVPLALAGLLWRRVNRQRALGPRNALLATAAGAALAVLSTHLEGLFLGLTGLSLTASRGGALAAMSLMFLFVAPLEEGLKVLAVWPLYRLRVLDGARLGMLYAACAGAGFGAVATFVHVAWAPELDGLVVLRAALGAPAHLFFAGVWGFALGSGRAGRGRWFSVAFFVSMLLHGLYAHIVFGRGPGILVAIAPLALGMIVTSWVALRESGLVQPSQYSLLQGLEPPSIDTVRRALTRKNRPVMPHFIALSALVTVGLMIALLAGAVYLGHRVGIDFAMANESDWRSTGPLTLLGMAVIASFPFAGFLVARATAATSVLEPALGAGLAIAAIVALLSMAAPVAVVFALAGAPVAFGLACGGAWFGLAR
jgi:ABC-type multidrug transport system fused ATPase/permease subunit